jgi:hypothetical protein
MKDSEQIINEVGLIFIYIGAFGLNDYIMNVFHFPELFYFISVLIIGILIYTYEKRQTLTIISSKNT